MSRYLSFYSVERPKEPVDGILDLDLRENEDVDYERAEKATGWKKSLGLATKVRRTNLDLFGAAEKEFGERPNCVSARPYDLGKIKVEYVFWMEDGTSREMLDVDVKKYETTETFDAFVWILSPIADARKPDFIEDVADYERRELEAEDFEKLISACLDEADEDPERAGEALIAIVKARRANKNGEAVVAFYD